MKPTISQLKNVEDLREQLGLHSIIVFGITDQLDIFFVGECNDNVTEHLFNTMAAALGKHANKHGEGEVYIPRKK
jgi:hypothetical protein